MPHEDIAEWYQPHQKYHHVLKPDFYQRFNYPKYDAVMTVQTNADGFRDFSHENDTHDGLKILFLGDSFVFGYGLEEDQRMDRYLRELAKEQNVPLSTVNWGVPGWGTKQEVMYAADHLQEVSPDIIVFLFCDNDPANNRGEQLPTLPNMASPLYPLKTWLRRYSHSYRWLLEIRAGNWRKRAIAPDEASKKNEDQISKEDWTQTEELMRQLCTQYASSHPNGHILLMATSPQEVPVKEHLEAIARGCEPLVYLDLQHYISNIPEKDRVLPWDGHWSQKMHKAAANAIMDWINDNIKPRR